MSDVKNPLLSRSSLPFGLPEYAQITPQHIEEAILAGMVEELEQWERIATHPAAPTVENTLEALDRSGELLTRATSVFWTLLSSLGGEELQSLQERLSPRLAAHADAYYLDERIYRRLLNLRATAELDEEDAWTLAEEIKAFELSGIALDESQKAQLQDLNMQVAALETSIDQRITKQLEETGLTVREAEQLAGLDQATIDSYRQADGWQIPCRNYTTQPEQSSLTSPAVRRDLLKTSMERGLGANKETDTRGRIIELAHLRAERAQLLGFPDHASYVMATETVPSVEVANAVLQEIGEMALARVKNDAEVLRSLARADTRGDGLQAADWPYYEDRRRQQELGFDSSTLKPYLELDSVLENGVFWAAGQLYGIQMRPRPDLFGWHGDVKVWEVQEADGEPLGLFLGDFYTRPGKSGGAWMAEIQTASPLRAQLPIISNDTNLTKPPAGEATLLTWDEVETLFHEFGHALHGFFSDTKYVENAGTNVPRDFVELPSQLNEMWAYHPRVLERFARHYRTGEPLPLQMRDAVAKLKTFGQGFATAEYVQAALIDQAWHRVSASELPTRPEDLAQFERDALEKAGVFEPLVPPRYRSAYFAHTFAGGYDAGYYAYMWAEMLAAEVENWFKGTASKDGDGGLNREAGQLLRQELLSRGNSRNPAESFRRITGVEPSPAAIAARRGLNAEKGS